MTKTFRRRVARYVRKTYRLVHFEWWSKTSNGPKYAMRPRITIDLLRKGEEKYCHQYCGYLNTYGVRTYNGVYYGF